MKKPIKKISVIFIILFFSGFIIMVSFVNPELGEKILYGKKGLEQKQNLGYSEIIISGNYQCMESSAILANGNLPKFIKEFNDCNNRS